MVTGQSAVAGSKGRLRVSAAALAQGVLLGIVLLLGLGIRLYDLKDAPLDFHPTRQLRSAIIARGIYYQSAPSVPAELRTQAVDIARSMEVYEPPIFEGLVALTYRVMGQEALWISRVYSALFWSVAGLALFALARRFASFYAALAGLGFFLFLPFSVIASRSFQPDPWMVMWLVVALWAIYRWSETLAWRWAILAGLSGGVGVLVKVVAIFPLALTLLAMALGVIGIKKALRNRQSWALVGLLLLPSLLYYLFGLGQRSSDFFSFWTVSLSHLLLTGNFYSSWLGVLHGLIGLTYLLVAVLGILVSARPVRTLLSGAWAGYVVYGLFFPYQMTTHEYYHLMLLPLVGLALVPAAELVFQRLGQQHWFWRAAGAGVLAFAVIYSLWSARSVLYVVSYENEVTSWQRMGAELPENGRIIAMTSEYGNRLKYYGRRSISGYWPFQSDLRLSELARNGKIDYPDYFKEMTEGMDYFLVTAFAEYAQQPELKDILEENYPLIQQGDGYILFDLKHPLSK